MRVLSLGYDPTYGDDAVRTAFGSDTSVFDFDLVIWDPLGGIKPYPAYQKYRGLPSITEDASVRLTGDVNRRKLEFAEFWESGRDIVVIARPSERAYYDTGERQHSGTGRNRVTTRLVSEIILQSALPVALNFQAASGTRVEVVGDGPVQRVLRKYKDYVRYSATISGALGSTIAKVSGTTKVISSLFRSPKGGQLLVLPSLSFEAREPAGAALDEDEAELDEGVESWAEEAPQFFADLLAALREVGGEKESSRPDWSEHFATQRQRQLRSQSTAAAAEVENARASLALAQQAVDQAEAADQLYLGTGRALELQVKEVLELLGGTVTEPEPGRDDWRVEFPEGPAVVEVKGVTKSGAEKHAAQLEKWVANYFEETGNQAKGLLIVNAWRELPLDERVESAFPDQMLKYSTTRQHCLMTGLQLFAIREEVLLGGSDPADWRSKIMATAGVLDGAPDWQEYIEKDDAREATNSGD